MGDELTNSRHIDGSICNEKGWSCRGWMFRRNLGEKIELKMMLRRRGQADV